ncbi:hypothetical protein CKO14_12055 [Halorhodospira halophila]|nr:hypothetical protein [Halorhodospira halophila]
MAGVFLGVSLDGEGCVARIRISLRLPTAASGPADRQVHDVVRCLEAWERDPLAPARLPRAPAASPFQARLREALLALEPGQTVSYGELARHLGTSPRAVGAGCRANPLPLLVPCHRVVGSRGAGGYAGTAGGSLTRFKAWLLAQEQR